MLPCIRHDPTEPRDLRFWSERHPTDRLEPPCRRARHDDRHKRRARWSASRPDDRRRRRSSGRAEGRSFTWRPPSRSAGPCTNEDMCVAHPCSELRRRCPRAYCRAACCCTARRGPASALNGACCIVPVCVHSVCPAAERVVMRLVVQRERAFRTVRLMVLRRMTLLDHTVPGRPIRRATGQAWLAELTAHAHAACSDTRLAHESTAQHAVGDSHQLPERRAHATGAAREARGCPRAGCRRREGRGSGRDGRGSGRIARRLRPPQRRCRRRVAARAGVGRAAGSADVPATLRLRAARQMRTVRSAGRRRHV